MRTFSGLIGLLCILQVSNTKDFKPSPIDHIASKRENQKSHQNLQQHHVINHQNASGLVNASLVNCTTTVNPSLDVSKIDNLVNNTQQILVVEAQSSHRSAVQAPYTPPVYIPKSHRGNFRLFPMIRILPTPSGNSYLPIHSVPIVYLNNNKITQDLKALKEQQSLLARNDDALSRNLTPPNVDTKGIPRKLAAFLNKHGSALQGPPLNQKTSTLQKRMDSIHRSGVPAPVAQNISQMTGPSIDKKVRHVDSSEVNEFIIQDVAESTYFPPEISLPSNGDKKSHFSSISAIPLLRNSELLKPIPTHELPPDLDPSRSIFEKVDRDTTNNRNSYRIYIPGYSPSPNTFGYLPLNQNPMTGIEQKRIPGYVPPKQGTVMLSKNSGGNRRDQSFEISNVKSPRFTHKAKANINSHIPGYVPPEKASNYNKPGSDMRNNQYSGAPTYRLITTPKGHLRQGGKHPTHSFELGKEPSALSGHLYHPTTDVSQSDEEPMFIYDGPINSFGKFEQIYEPPFLELGVTKHSHEIPNHTPVIHQQDFKPSQHHGNLGQSFKNVAPSRKHSNIPGQKFGPSLHTKHSYEVKTTGAFSRENLEPNIFSSQERRGQWIQPKTPNREYGVFQGGKKTSNFNIPKQTYELPNKEYNFPAFKAITPTHFFKSSRENNNPNLNFEDLQLKDEFLSHDNGHEDDEESLFRHQDSSDVSFEEPILLHSDEIPEKTAQEYGTGKEQSFDLPENSARDHESYDDGEYHSCRQSSFDPDGDCIQGQAKVDYPDFTRAPKTFFSCEGRVPGIYADIDSQCQAWHYCLADGRMESFVCPVGTMFSQRFFTCDWWYNVQCGKTESYFHLNQEIYDKYRWQREAPRFESQKVREDIYITESESSPGDLDVYSAS
ncbi:hypothetical protein SK128_016530 [Halocaridina rubra]|uniref:Chitin-binding type-2 domain-containing protein n=1 Tax=Halocaridina rubra TaxID=373956 RepID=A0AAN8XGV4_HALRR